MLGDIWNSIVSFVTYPHDLWVGTKDCVTYPDGYKECYSYGPPDHFGAIFFGFLVLVAAVVVFAIVFYIAYRAHETYVWYRHRQPCQHQECGGQWTMQTSTGSDPGCVAGRPCCPDCVDRHAADATQRRANGEPLVDCPRGHGAMHKVIEDHIIYDKCSAGCVFFDADELAAIRQKVTDEAYAEGYEDGRSSGSSSGFASGIAAGIAIS